MRAAVAHRFGKPLVIQEVPVPEECRLRYCMPGDRVAIAGPGRLGHLAARDAKATSFPSALQSGHGSFRASRLSPDTQDPTLSGRSVAVPAKAAARCSP